MNLKTVVYIAVAAAFAVVIGFFVFKQSQDIKIEIVSEPIELAENPHWEAERQTLYFADTHNSKVHRYVPSTKEHYVAKVGTKPVTFIVPVDSEKDKFVVSYGADVALITWDGKSDEVSTFTILATLDSRPQNRINDGKVSPSGVLFAGTMGADLPSGGMEKNKGILCSFKNMQVKELLDNVTCSNGLAWSKDEKKFYYIDTFSYKVDSFDYDVKENVLSNRKMIYDFSTNSGVPDGMTIDADGKLWVASWGGYHLLRIDPSNGKVLKKIEFPSSQITSAAFGGPNLDDLYVTSAFYKLSAEERKKNPNSGVLFKVTGHGTKGLPGVFLKL